MHNSAESSSQHLHYPVALELKTVVIHRDLITEVLHDSEAILEAAYLIHKVFIHGHNTGAYNSRPLGFHHSRTRDIR